MYCLFTGHLTWTLTYRISSPQTHMHWPFEFLGTCTVQIHHTHHRWQVKQEPSCATFMQSNLKIADVAYSCTVGDHSMFSFWSCSSSLRPEISHLEDRGCSTRWSDFCPTWSAAYCQVWEVWEAVQLNVTHTCTPHWLYSLLIDKHTYADTWLLAQLGHHELSTSNAISHSHSLYLSLCAVTCYNLAQTFFMTPCISFLNLRTSCCWRYASYPER